MKRYLRCCLIFLISLALPLSGMAGIQAPTEPCPMEMARMAMMDDIGPDCCHDMKSLSDHGKPCKPGQECKTGGMLQVSIIKPPLALSSPVLASVFVDSLPAQPPSAVWRPPCA
ncbi:hypothetical protein [Pseudomonas sp. GD03696]|uniref:hypothetical protein n=1 Tax=Pseudomonas sp. GD03696 TaxID=2975368 RepID=UPI00244B229C|nr:hypothetical protein [Pseudomonas sp. GD03696]MDH1932803.1 hypothetical protein [Pseudomonas sp. GD03696]